MTRQLFGIVLLSLCWSCAKEEVVYDPGPNDDFTPVFTRLVAPVCEPKAAGLTGRILVSAIIKTDGSVGSVRPHSSDVTAAGCDDAVIQAVRQWRFEPINKDGHPIALRVITGSAFPFPESPESGVVKPAYAN